MKLIKIFGILVISFAGHWSAWSNVESFKICKQFTRNDIKKINSACFLIERNGKTDVPVEVDLIYYGSLEGPLLIETIQLDSTPYSISHGRFQILSGQNFKGVGRDFQILGSFSYSIESFVIKDLDNDLKASWSIISQPIVPRGGSGGPCGGRCRL